MSLSDLIRSLPNEHPARSELDQQLRSTREKVSFYGIRIDVKTPSSFTIIETSHNHHSPSFEQDGKTYTVPKAVEHCFDASNPRMLLWELNDELFTGDLQCWRGWYCVWYLPTTAKFYVTRLADGGAGYVNVPGLRKWDLNFWFRREMAEIRDQLVKKYGR